MRRHRALFIPLVALCRRHFSVDFITNMSEFDFRQAQERRNSPAGKEGAMAERGRPGQAIANSEVGLMVRHCRPTTAPKPPRPKVGP
jgi:hypothetical protein